MKIKTYEKLFKGFEITHASIKKPDKIVFIAQKAIPSNKDYQPAEELPTRFISWYVDSLEEDEGYGYLEMRYGVRNGYVSTSDQGIIIASSFGKVWENNAGDNWHKIVTETDAQRFLTGITKIGHHIFACGSGRKVYRRDGLNNWVDLVDEQQHSYVYSDIIERKKRKISHIGYPMGFECIAGFHEEEIYAGGGNGDCWRYDGTLWHRVDLQTNTDVAAIVCGDNGKVYICLANGKIIIGRNNQWQLLDTKINEYSFAADVMSAAWFQGKLYLGTPFDLYVLEGDQLSRYQFPKEGPRQSSFAHVASCEDALLSYGNDQALVFDGVQWKEIVNRPLFAQDSIQ